MKDRTTPISTAAVDPLVMRLRRYNEWRRGADFEQPEPTEIWHDIDAAIDLLESIRGALTDCHNSFKRREHGGVAEQKLRHDLERILAMPYDG